MATLDPNARRADAESEIGGAPPTTSAIAYLDHTVRLSRLSIARRESAAYKGEFAERDLYGFPGKSFDAFLTSGER